MLTLSVLWVILAAAVTLAALSRRSATESPNRAIVGVSDKSLALIAVLSCVVLVAGFFYVGRFLVAGL